MLAITIIEYFQVSLIITQLVTDQLFIMMQLVLHSMVIHSSKIKHGLIYWKSTLLLKNHIMETKFPLMCTTMLLETTS